VFGRVKADCATGKRFLLQGGDCAEQFAECQAVTIENKIKILLQQSLVLTYGASMPTVRIGRMAGQFAKPRSSDSETIGGVTLPSYRGDNVNGYEFNEEQRTNDPARLLSGYFHSAATINYMRVAMAEGLADLRHADAWSMDFVKNVKRRDEYANISERIVSALNFIQTCGAESLDPVLRSVDMFTSHEALHLDYEEAMTIERGGKYYNGGAHYLWIGDRTRQLDHAHVEYMRGIANPIGVKVGPPLASNPAELVALIQRLWPDPSATPGKVSLITRFGAQKIRDMLPGLIQAVQHAGLPVLWVCDPCHGNTTTASSGHKTRDFDSILKEVEECIAIHQEMGSILGGVHFELTGDNVTECTGGPQALTENDLPERYNTLCDPRLNYAQSLEMAFRITEKLKARQESNKRRTPDQGGMNGSKKPKV